MDPQLLIFDALTFTLATGSDEFKDSAVETIEGIREIKAELPGVLTSLGVSNVSFGFGRAAREVLNSVFLHHCVEAGLDLAMVHPEPTSRPTRRSRSSSATSPTTSSSTAARTRRSASSSTSRRRARRPRRRRPTRPPAWSRRRRCTSTSCGARRTASRTGSTRSVEKIGAVPTLNDVLLPAMKEVGDKFGAGELILPFVLQSAEVMKKAVARLENYLDRIEGYTKGTVVIATVFGDVHDIGKSLVNTILTNNGYTVVDLGKQVPISTILDAAQEHEATAIGLSALLVSTSKQMPLCVQELHERALPFPVLIGGAAINRDFGLRILYPHGQRGRRRLRARRLLLQGRVRGPGEDGPAGRRARRARRSSTRRARRRERCARSRSSWTTAPPTTDASVRSRRAHRRARPDAAVVGRARGRGAARRGLPAPRHARALQAPLGRARREGRRLARARQRRTSSRAWSACGREQTYLHPRAKLGYFPAASEGNEVVIFDPEDHEREIDRLVFPRQPSHDRICLADFYRPLELRARATSSRSRSSPPATRSPS